MSVSDQELFGEATVTQDREMDRLLGLVGRLLETQGRSQTNQREFKSPEYDGKSDVEFFIRQFVEVSDANGWRPRAELLHLRASLKEGAQECGKAADARGIFEALRARYGTSPREARNKLLNLKKEYKVSLQEHASEVEGLVELAFGDLPERTRRELTLEAFCNSLNHTYLQRHLLAMQPENLADAVRSGNEFLQVRASTSTGVRMVAEDEDDEVETTPQVVQVKVDPMDALLEAITNLTKEVGKLKEPPTRQRREDSNRQPTGQCWGCGKKGHMRNKCPSKPWEQASGNATSPQQ